MPVKIRHKDNHKLSEITITEWNSHQFYKPNYNVISKTDIVKVWFRNDRIPGNWQEMGQWELSEYLKMIDEQPNYYRKEDMPNEFYEDEFAIKVQATIDKVEKHKRDSQHPLVNRNNPQKIDKLVVKKVVDDLNKPLQYLPNIENHRAVKTPTYAIRTIKAITSYCLSFLKKDYIKLTIIGVLILLIWFFIYPFLKSYFGHS